MLSIKFYAKPMTFSALFSSSTIWVNMPVRSAPVIDETELLAEQIPTTLGVRFKS